MNHVLKSPLDVQIEITSSCNHKCRHCYNFWKHQANENTSNSSLSMKNIERIFNQLGKEMIISSTITGGEPFMFPERVFYALEKSMELGIKTDINSNLTLLDGEMISRLSMFNNLSILTSLLSFKEKEHDFLTSKNGSYKKVVENIRLCAEKGIKVSVNMVLCRENMGHIYETAVLAKNLGARTFCASRAVPPLGSRDFNSYAISTLDLMSSLDSLIEIENKLGMHTEILGCYPKCTLLPKKEHRKFFNRICVAGKTTVTIGSNGNVRPCSHSDTSYGNILSEELEKIWQRMYDWRNGSYTPEICKKCYLVELCTCGCRIEAQHHGDISGMDRHAVPENVKKIPIVDNRDVINLESTRNLFLGKRFIINKDLRFRKESFGGIIFLAGTRIFISVSTPAFSYLHGIYQKNKEFSCEEFESDSGAKNEKDVAFVLSLFKRLSDKNIIKERR